MVVISPLLEDIDPCSEESVRDFHALAEVVERPSSPLWTLPGLEPWSFTSESLDAPAVPLIWVGSNSHDVFCRLENSIEEISREPSQRRVFVDPGAESAEPKKRVAPWMEAVAARFAELVALRADWNGHGACPIASANIIAAGRFLAAVMKPSTPAPTIVPTGGGGMQLEWHRAGLDVELLFGEEDPPLLYVAELSSGHEWEGAPIEGFAEFELAQRLIG
jgi:hypothetical protein